MNSLTLVARLIREPDLRVRGLNKVCVMRVVEVNGGRSPLFINVTAFGVEAESCVARLRTGSEIAVVGRLRLSKWQPRGGAERLDYSVAAERVDFLPSPSRDFFDAPDQPAAKPARPRRKAAPSGSAKPPPAPAPDRAESRPPLEAVHQDQLFDQSLAAPACQARPPSRRSSATRLLRRLLSPQRPSSRS